MSIYSASTVGQPTSSVMDKDGMTSPKAEAARQKSAEIMAALKKGEPGAADELMGKPKTVKGPTAEVRGNPETAKGGSERGGWVGRLLGAGKLKGKAGTEDGVVR